MAPRRAGKRSSAHRVLLRPAAGRRLVLRPVRLVHVGNLRDKRVVRVGVGQQGADGEQDLRNCQSRAPLLFENVKAYTSIAVDIRMEDLCLERNLWRFEGVIWREMNVH